MASTSALPDVPAEVRAPSSKRRLPAAAAVLFLLAILVIELLIPAWQQSMAFDEGCHLLAGYSYWRWSDFGVNPEHPPLVKLLAALPFAGRALRYPASAPVPFSKIDCFVGGREFLYSNSVSAEAILLPARGAVCIISVLAALLTFAVACDLFGVTAGLIALLLFVFEPNLIAQGSFITTDMAVTLFLLATVYAFYRFVKKPSVLWLLLTGVSAGLALASKHSGVLVVPILLLLALSRLVWNEPGSSLTEGGAWKHALRLAASLLLVGALSVAILWAFYGFRYEASRVESLSAPLEAYAHRMHAPAAEQIILAVARRHLLPEAYLYGLADVLIASHQVTPYLLGKFYLKGQWFYFPAVFAIKSTLGFLLLLILVPAAFIQRRLVNGNSLLFVILPAAAYLAVAMNSSFNVGVRHILPVYPFLIVLAAFSACSLARFGKAGSYLAGVLLIFHVISSARAFPNYLPYSNEAFGGPSRTYTLLSDSNVDWGQQLKQTKKYLDQHGIRDCWFAYFGRSVADPAYYGIRCKALPESLAFLPGETVPEHISGTILISANDLSPGLWGPGELNPYARFQQLRPDDSIANGILVFRGEFDLPLAAAISHVRAAQVLLQGENLSGAQIQQALAEAQTAVSLAPDYADSEALLGDLLLGLNQRDEARAAYQKALKAARANYPDYQSSKIAMLEQKLR